MPYIRFGNGQRTFVIIIGMNMTGLAGLAGPVSDAYRIFTDDYTVYVFDRIDPLPDDYSVREMAHDIAAAMRQLGLSSADVMGVSQGGMIAQYLAVDAPALVHALALCSTWSRPGDIGREIFEKWTSLAARGDSVGIYRSFFDLVYTHLDVNLLRLLETTGTPEQCRRFGILARACRDGETWNVLDKIRCPALVVGAGRDRMISRQAPVDLAAKLGCELSIYEDFGHAAYDEAPDYKERMLRFFRRSRVDDFA